MSILKQYFWGRVEGLLGRVEGLFGRVEGLLGRVEGLLGRAEGFWTHLGASGVALEHHVDPIGRHCAVRGLNCDVFLMTLVRNPVFCHFWVANRKQKVCI